MDLVIPYLVSSYHGGVRAEGHVGSCEQACLAAALPDPASWFCDRSPSSGIVQSR